MDEPGALEARRTPAQRTGDATEEVVAARLAAVGWRIIGRNVRVGRSEIDIVAADPGPPPALVAVEVRWRGRRDFGLPEETIDWRKRRFLHRAIAQLSVAGALPDGTPLPPGSWRIDVVAVEPAGAGVAARVRHHRGVG